MKKTYIVPATTRFDVKMQGMIAASNPPIDTDPDHAGSSNFSNKGSEDMWGNKNGGIWQ